MVAKTVEYAALGIPMVCTPLRGTVRYWGTNPIIRFSNMNPDSFAERLRDLETLGVEVEILGPAQMEKLGMGALLGVAQ